MRRRSLSRARGRAILIRTLVTGAPDTGRDVLLRVPWKKKKKGSETATKSQGDVACNPSIERNSQNQRGPSVLMHNDLI